MTCTYKQLTTSDVPLLKNLLQVFGQAFNEIPTYQTAVPSDAYLQSLLAKPHFIAVTALHGNEVVGGLAAYVLEKFEQGPPRNLHLRPGRLRKRTAEKA